MKNIFSGLTTGVVLITVFNKPALAHKTYSRERIVIRINTLRHTIPAPGRSLAMSAVERRGSNDPAPRACISMGAKAINTRRGIAPTTIPPINRQLQAEVPLSWILRLRTAILIWKELSLAVFLVEPW